MVWLRALILFLGTILWAGCSTKSGTFYPVIGIGFVKETRVQQSVKQEISVLGVVGTGQKLSLGFIREKWQATAP
jgi:hypothetical protein